MFVKNRQMKEVLNWYVAYLGDEQFDINVDLG